VITQWSLCPRGIVVFILAKQKNIPKINSKKVSKAKKHNYLLLDEKTLKKIRKKHRGWQRYMETRDWNKYQW
jgi:hypothetical protein